jgi:phospholipase/carboxylesterase
MTLFRVNTEKPIDGPHQSEPFVTFGADPEQAQVGVVLVHGRGASAQSMIGLAKELGTEEIRYLAPQAANFTWYPYPFTNPLEQNQPGMSSGLQKIHDGMQQLVEEGLDYEQIFLIGFSQGACLSLEFAARHPRRYGGIAGLSGGMIGIGPRIPTEHYEGDLQGTPVFLGCSDRDPHIAKERVNESAEMLSSLGATVDKRFYPNMGHTVNQDELQAVREMLADAIGT